MPAWVCCRVEHGNLVTEPRELHRQIANRGLTASERLSVRRISRVVELIRIQKSNVHGSTRELVLSLRQMSQELVHAVLESREMQEIRLIEDRLDESGAFVRHQRTTQLHLPLHDQED